VELNFGWLFKVGFPGSKDFTQGTLRRRISFFEGIGRKEWELRFQGMGLIFLDQFGQERVGKGVLTWVFGVIGLGGRR